MATAPGTGHAAFPQPDDPATKVWRYLDLAKSIDLLRRKQLHLPNIAHLGDPYEGSFTQSVIDAWSRDGPGAAERAVQIRDMLKRGVFASCWHANPYESDAMWVRYGRDTEGMALQTTYGALRDSIRPWGEGAYIGCVRYVDHTVDEQADDGDVLVPMMQKRKAFEHEREVRIVWFAPEQAHTHESSPRGVYLPWDPEMVLEGVYLNPLAEDWFFEVVGAVLERFAPRLAPLLRWSRIKVEPYR